MVLFALISDGKQQHASGAVSRIRLSARTSAAAKGKNKVILIPWLHHWKIEGTRQRACLWRGEQDEVERMHNSCGQGGWRCINSGV